MKEILLVDDHSMIRDAIKLYVYKSKEFKVVAEAENGKVALDLMSQRSYDIVITDLNMPGINGLELARTIQKNYPGQMVMALSMDYNDDTIKKLASAGVRGYLFKNIVKEDFIKALSVVSMGGKYFSEGMAKKLSFLDFKKHLHEFKSMPTRKKLMISGKLIIEGAMFLA